MSPTQERILSFAKTKPTFKTQDLVTLLRISRQTVSSHLKRLVNQGMLVKTGSTHSAQYRIKRKGEKAAPELQLKLIKKLKDLQEDEVFEEIRNRLGLRNLLNKQVLSIAYYSFCEMMNNAIDHSSSAQASVEIRIEGGYFTFKIRDYGIGIFNHVKRCFKLENEYQGAEHVLKGKQTTAPERHSGQGIFFTSRIADHFTLYSHRLRVVVNNEKDDAYFADASFVKGTQVEFRIKQRSKKNLQTLFSQFSKEEDNFEFNKNEIRVRLRANRELVSRSQARKLLMGLDEFKHIIFDFKDIPGIGQAFADEIFRVYPALHSDKKIGYENAGPAVEFMIQRALSSYV